MDKWKWPIINIVSVLIYIAIGVVCCMFINDLGFETSIYLIVQIITTIGYGDIPVEPHFRVFMCVYVIIGIALIASTINDIATRMTTAAQEAMRARMRDVEGGDTHVSDFSKALNGLITSMVILAVFVFGGSLFYWWWEPCTCSYGVSAIKTCNETKVGSDDYDYDRCVATGGTTTSYFGFMYMSVITLTTVGFGDISPKTRVGRCWFGFPWLICGVVAFGNFVACVTAVINVCKNGKQNEDYTDRLREAFDEVDKDDDGDLSAGEFLAWSLVAHDLVDQDTIAAIQERYAKMKEDAGGHVDKDFIMQHLGNSGSD